MADLEKYGLDLHCTMILEEYQEMLPVFNKLKEVVYNSLKDAIAANGLYVTAIEARVKSEASLAGKLELKGNKYMSLDDLTDILGARVITFYSDEVDKIAAMVDRLFVIDWKNSVDKRKMHDLDSFGYNSLHFICSVPKSLFYDPAMPQLNNLRFELQMRTALQHVWATMYHDTGYKSGVEVPKEYLRNLNRLAGMLELADEQFSFIRTSINDYRRKVQGLVESGKFEEVPLDAESFKSYLSLDPFDRLTRRIAAINQAEVHETSLLSYLPALHLVGCKTLADVEKIKKEDSEDAYQFAVFEIGNTDLDIISSTISIQDLLVVHILKSGGGEKGLKELFDILYGESDYNIKRAQRILEISANLHFMN